VSPGIDLDALLVAAREARSRAYAPYSKYRVGAAILAEDGRVFSGCNVENATYGLTVCAERTAVVSMVAAGVRRVLAAAVVTGGPEAGTPCGMCRQTLAEFAEDAPVISIAVDDEGREIGRRLTSVAELLPHAFRGDLVLRGHS
jgi:cytidine deaminase